MFNGPRGAQDYFPSQVRRHLTKTSFRSTVCPVRYAPLFPCTADLLANRVSASLHARSFVTLWPQQLPAVAPNSPAAEGPEPSP